MSVIGRWKITAPRSPRKGENWRLECGALDGQIIPAGESVIVVPEHQLAGAVALLREAQRSMHWDNSVPVDRRFRWATDVDALDPPTTGGQ